MHAERENVLLPPTIACISKLKKIETLTLSLSPSPFLRVSLSVSWIGSVKQEHQSIFFTKTDSQSIYCY